MIDPTISILDGSTFVVSDTHGDIELAADPETVLGFFFRDTRFLSLWTLSVDGSRPAVLSIENATYFAAQFFLYPPTGTIYENPSLSVIRKRKVGDGFHEDITLINHDPAPRAVELRLDAACDFADLFEVKDALRKKGEHSTSVTADALVLGYRRDGFVRETRIVPGEPAEIDEHGLTFRVEVPAHGEWNTCIDVLPVTDPDAAPTETKYGHDGEQAQPNMAMSMEQWLANAPALESDVDEIEHVYRKSLVDLAALRFYSILFPGDSLPAAGLPWFMTIFGRDSLITSYQALPFAPDLARTALRVLAARQGATVDDFRDQEPGKILHEIRFGELTQFGERPHSPYFGAADTTPMFLVLLDEYERWTGDVELVRSLEPNARAALRWIDEYGDRDGDGYVEYDRRNRETGLENQCWKDSWNSIIHNDGTLARLPRATCEIQGLVYDARRRSARLAREVWGDEELGRRLDRAAADLKARFNTDFWLPDRDFYALALDGDKQPVATLASNAGQLLWSGIVDDDRADIVVRQLMSERFFSGWGVRTMAEGEGPYNPIEYHNGTVWPHDNAFIAAGMARYGHREEAARIAQAMFEAAAFFDYRLPEVFAGYPRARTNFPVEYPTACSPQAWATGTPLLLLRVLLGLEPEGDHLAVDPVLPPRVSLLRLAGVHGRWGRTDAVGTGPGRVVT